MAKSFSIEVLDVLECRCTAKLAKIIRPCLFYTYENSAMTEFVDYSYFYTGLLPRVNNYCKQRGIELTISGYSENVAHRSPKLNMLKLREDHIRMVSNALVAQRGVLVAPIDRDRTAMAMAIISAYLGNRHDNVLWLCHKNDLIYQVGAVAEKELGIKVGYFGDGNNDFRSKFTVTTKQSFINISHEWGWRYDIIIVDELHHVSGFDGQYAGIMQSILAPVRIGLTATMPENKEAKLAIEAFIGPIIGKVADNASNAEDIFNAYEIQDERSGSQLPQTAYAKGGKVGKSATTAQKRSVSVEHTLGYKIVDDHTYVNVMRIRTKWKGKNRLLWVEKSELDEFLSQPKNFREVSRLFDSGKKPNETGGRIKLCGGTVWRWNACVVKKRGLFHFLFG